MNRQSLQASARADAIKRLQRKHADDWHRIYGEEREKRGLPPEIGDKSLYDQNRMLQYRIEELEARLAEYRVAT